MPDTKVGRCLEPDGNGVSPGEGGEVGPGPPNKEGDKQSTPSEEGGNMERGRRKVKSGVTKRNQRAQSEHLQKNLVFPFTMYLHVC